MKKQKITFYSDKEKEQWINDFKKQIPVWTKEKQKRHEKFCKSDPTDDDFYFFRKEDDLDIYCIYHEGDNLGIELWCSLDIEEKQGQSAITLKTNSNKIYYVYGVLPFFLIMMMLFSIVAQTLFYFGFLVIAFIFTRCYLRFLCKKMAYEIVNRLKEI